MLHEISFELTIRARIRVCLVLVLEQYIQHLNYPTRDFFILVKVDEEVF